MKIIIVGCGKVGETLAAVLGQDGNDITVVDLSAEKVKSISEKLDVMGVVGNGATNTTLREAGRVIFFNPLRDDRVELVMLSTALTPSEVRSVISLWWTNHPLMLVTLRNWSFDITALAPYARNKSSSS